MIDAFYIAATGLQAQQTNVDAIANNLANVNTIGFKKSRANFSDLIVHETSRTGQTGNADLDVGEAASATRSGAGVGIASLAKLFDLGDLKQTGAPLDVAIQGAGFFQVTMPDGSTAYTRGGSLKVNSDGLLATQAGYPLRPGIAMPDGAQNIVITSDGRVQYSIAGQSGTTEAGQLELARFANPGMLQTQGDNLYRTTDAAGAPVIARPGEDGTGATMQGVLESSNVKLNDEMVNLVVAQRAYEATVKVIQASDEISALINNLRK
jgi:flagellar basal-body rod protein FlgG